MKFSFQLSVVFNEEERAGSHAVRPHHVDLGLSPGGGEKWGGKFKSCVSGRGNPDVLVECTYKFSFGFSFLCRD